MQSCQPPHAAVPEQPQGSPAADGVAQLLARLEVAAEQQERGELVAQLTNLLRAASPRLAGAQPSVAPSSASGETELGSGQYRPLASEHEAGQFQPAPFGVPPPYAPQHLQYAPAQPYAHAYAPPQSMAPPGWPMWSHGRSRAESETADADARRCRRGKSFKVKPPPY